MENQRQLLSKENINGGPTIFQNLYIFFIRLKILLASPAFNVGVSRNIICPVMQKLFIITV